MEWVYTVTVRAVRSAPIVYFGRVVAAGWVVPGLMACLMLMDWQAAADNDPSAVSTLTWSEPLNRLSSVMIGAALVTSVWPVVCGTSALPWHDPWLRRPTPPLLH